MEQSTADTISSHQTARMLADHYVVDKLRHLNASSSGPFSVAGRSVIAVVGLSTAVILGGLVASSAIVGIPALFAGIGCVTTGIVGAYSGATAVALNHLQPTLKDYRAFEANWLPKPEIREELTQEVSRQLKENHKVDFLKVVENVGHRHGLFPKETHSWSDRVKQSKTMSGTEPAK